ncbi:MAG: SIMPL domain-containing protein [Anaerolineales bacterium]
MRTRFLSLAVLSILSLLLAACGQTTIYAQPAPQERTLTVSGSGMVTLTPDIAYVSIGVHTQDESANAAIGANNARAEAVIRALRGFGIEERDIQTTNFSIYPQPIYDENYNQIGVTYVVDNTVYVTVRDLEVLGELLDSAVRAGATTIGSIAFDVSDRTEALSQARLAAVENARRQAEELASATGVALGEVITISYYDSTPLPYTDAARINAPMAEMAASVPVQAGTLQITTTVTIVYSLH